MKHRHRLLLLTLLVVTALALAAAPALAFPTETSPCSSCHAASPTATVAVGAPVVGATTATYNINGSKVSGTWGWGVFSGTTKIAGGTGASFALPLDAKIYDVYWVDQIDPNNMVGYAHTTVTTPLPPPSATTVQQTDAKLLYLGTWTSVANVAFSGGTVKRLAATGSVTVSFTGTGIQYLAAKGPDLGQAKLTLDGVVQTPNVDLYAATVSSGSVFTKSGLVSKNHVLKIEYTGLKNAASTGKAVSLDALKITGGTLTAVPATRIEEPNGNLAYQGTWAAVSLAGASGGTYRSVNITGTAVTVAFQGTSCRLIGPKGPTMGQATVTVDGVAQATKADFYAATAAQKQVVWTSPTLAAGAHKVKIAWAGTRNTNSSGTLVALDAFDIVGYVSRAQIRYEQNNTKLIYAPAWTAIANALHSGGSQAQISSAGSMTATFKGTSINLIATKGLVYGKAKLTLDGSLTPVTVDLYSAATLYKQSVWASALLAAGTHTLKVEWTGTKNALATGTTVNVDAVDVGGTL